MNQCLLSSIEKKNKSLRLSFNLISKLSVCLLLFANAANMKATTCAGATTINPASLPIVNQAVSCGTTNDITAGNVAASVLTGGCNSTNYFGGNEAVYVFTPTTTGTYDISYTGQTWTAIFITSGCPTTAGSTCVGGVSSSTASKSLTVSLTAGVTYYLMFETWPTPVSACPGNFSMQLIVPNTATAVAQGGLWSSPQTWVSGQVPNIMSKVIVPAGATVVVDQVVSIDTLIVSGILEWNATANAMTVKGNTTINSGGRLLPYSTGLGVVTMNLGGDFTNNGYANLTRTVLNFNGSQQTASMAQTLGGSGVFEGNNTHGIINALFFQTTGSSVINTSQNIITYSLAHTAGSLNTNSKVTIDNTAQVYGKKMNTQVVSAHVTNMGSGLTTNTIRVVGGTTAPAHWTASGTTTAGTLIIRDTNLYRATSTTLPATAPNHTSGTVGNLLWVGTVGTLGNPFNHSASVTAGTTPIFYGDNLYACIVTGTPSSTAPPTHTSGTAVSGGATFQYIGRAAKALPNYDNTNKALRSLTLVVNDSGYTAAPSMTFVRDSGNTTGTLPAATAVVPQSLPGTANSAMQKSGVASFTGSITINSDQGAGVLAPANYKTSSSSGVGAVSTTNGGVNYTVAPTVGFAGPTALNLVTNSGSGYSSAPTITVTGGTLISGTALTSANFIITTNQGKVVSVYLNAGTTATYSTPPSLSFTGGGGSGATLDFPSGCWPAATAIIGPNGQITNFNVTNSGYGYVAAPTVGIGTTSGTTAGGTFSVVATAPTCRLGMYNLTLNFFTPATSAVVQTDIPQIIPANRKLNNLSLAGNGNGLNITVDSLLVYGSTPFTLASSSSVPGNILDLGGKTIHFSWNGYAGTTNANGTFNRFIRNGSMTLTTRGGGTTGSTLDFPFHGQDFIPFRYFTGTGTGVTDGADVLTVKVTEVLNPNNTTNGAATAFAQGKRSFRVRSATTLGATPTFGTNPTVRLSYASVDTLLALQNQTIIAQSVANTGPWIERSATIGAGATALAATGSITTATAVPGPIAPTADDYFTWASNVAVCSGTPDSATIVPPTNLRLCVNDNYIPTTSGATTSVGATYYWLVSSSPTGPFDSISINTGSTGLNTLTPTIKNSVAGTFYYRMRTRCAMSGLTRLSQVDTVTYLGGSIVNTPPNFCGTGGNVRLAITPSASFTSVSWSALTGTATFPTTSSGAVDTATITETSDFQANVTFTGGIVCGVNTSVGLYALPSATLTSTAQGVCPGTSLTINTGLTAGNFAVNSTSYIAYTIPATATYLMNASTTPVVPLTGGTIDDGGWSNIPIGFNFNYFGTNFNTISAGTNGLLMFGTPPGYGTAAGQLGQFNFAGPPVFPNTANPGNIIALMAGDQWVGNGKVVYWNEGFAPNRKFVILYEDINRCCGATNPTFTARAILYETTGIVEIHILNNNQTTAANTVGLQDATRTIGAIATGRTGVWSTTTPEAWRFTPPSNYRTIWDSNSVRVDSGTNIFSKTFAPINTTLYSVSYSNLTTGCTNAPGSAQINVNILSPIAPTGHTTQSNLNPVCVNTPFRLTTSYIGSKDGMTHQWQDSIAGGSWNNIASATDTFLVTNIPAARFFRCRFTRCGGSPTFTAPLLVNVNNPTPSAFLHDTICGIDGVFTLGATKSAAADSLYWFADSLSTVKIASGTSYTTPQLTARDTFWVQQVEYNGIASGIGANTATVPPNGGATAQRGIVINATSPFRILSADYYSASTGVTNNINVVLQDSITGATVFGPQSVSVVQGATAGWYTVNLNIPVPVGSYRLLADFSQAVNRIGTGFTGYPMAISTYGNITTGYNFGVTATEYNYFHNITVASSVCEGTKRPVYAVFTTPPALTLSRDLDSVCAGSNMATPVGIVTSTTNFNTYTWSPTVAPPTITGNITSGFNIAASDPGVYVAVLTGTQTGGQQCVNRDTFTLKVKYVPETFTNDPATDSVNVCNGTKQSIASSNILNVNGAKIGSGTTGTAGPTVGPFYSFYEDQRTQHLILASEMKAMGFKAGKIDSVSYIITSSTSSATALTDFDITYKMAHTNATSLTGYLTPSTWTTCYYEDSFPNPGAAAATIMFPFTTAFEWDGYSNILIEMCQNNADWSGDITWEATTTAFPSTFGTWQDGQAVTCATNSNTTANTSRANPTFFQNVKYPVTWSPNTNLFTNAGATTSYTSGARDTVWSAHNDTIKYYMTATHPNGCAIKDSIVLNIKDTVTINTQPPAFAAFCQGDTLKLSVSASSTSPMTYQWKKNGLNINTGLNASAGTNQLLIPNATQADSGTYEVEITTGTPCGTKTSIASTVKVRLPITITTQPKDTTVCLGAPFAVIAAATNDSSRMWTQIGGSNTGTNNTFSVGASAYTDSGRYFITYIPQTPCPTKNSDTVRVRVLPAAQIVADPATLTTLCIGDSVTLKAIHFAALGFQWLKNGSPIMGATKDSITIKANSLADSGEYRLVVYSPTGCSNDTTTMGTGVIKINLPVNITAQPLAKTFVCQNSPFVASVTASNTSGYQWEKNMTTIFAATNATFNTITSAQPSDAGVYRVLVKGLAPCPDVYSTNDTLVVTTLAAITTQPTAFQVCEDQGISITGAATNAASYQWLRNGTAISPNGNVQTYTKGGNPATMADSGMYRLVALSNPAGATTCKADTSIAVLGAVVRKIQITTQPLANTAVCQNSAFNTAISAQNVTGYQWKKGGTNVSVGTGGATANYSITSTQPGDAGVYTVEMTGNSPCPNVTSTTNTLAVTTLAAITTQPTAFQVCEDQGISITGAASNAASYQWLRNGTAISPNGNVQTYTKGGNPATMADSGMYRLVALSNNAGATTCKADTSAAVLGAVVRKIQIITQPPVFSYGCINANFSMNIVAQNVTGYSWRLNGSPIGQTTSTMSRTPFTMADTGNYTVVMTGNSPCPIVTSNIAKVDPTTAAVITTEPQSTDVCLGNSVTLTVAASAQQSYQWRKNGVNIAGQTGTSLTINPAAYADAATYDVIAVAFNGCTNDTSVGAVVSVKTPLAITSPLATTDVKCEGQNISYTTGVSGDGPFTYTWRLNGSVVGTNSTNYAKTGVVTSDSGRYIVNIQGSMACPALRDTIDLDVNKAPQIVTQPNGASPVCLGSNIVLTAAAANHTSLEWHKQGTGYLGQTANTYMSTGSTTADAGDYFVIAKAQPACTDVTSNTMNVQVNIPVTITLQPQGMDLLETPPGSHTMSVIASGTGPLNYKWFKNGVLIPGANNSSLSISNYVAANDSGNYHVEITAPSPCSNTVVSNIAKIATVKCPKIFGDTVRAVNICAGRPFSLDVTATGAKSYQWFRNNVAITGATQPNYSIPKASTSHAGIYRCRVFAFNEAICDPTYTDSIVVTVKDKPTITMHPEGIKLCAVSTHTMRVKASFGETFQWYRNGIAISPDGDRDSFVYNNVNTIGDVFYVEVGNNLCPSTNSNPVTIKSVIPGNQVFLANNSEFDLIERCSDANGWTYYATTTQTERLLMAIKKNGNNITAKPDLELMNGIREISSINAENKGAILGGRIFNLDITGTINNPYEVKFYYNKAEGDAVLARLNDIKLANPGQFSTDKIDLSFILTTQQSFTSSVWNNLTIPLNIPHTISFRDKEFGTENGVNFVILKQLVSPKLGGTIYMDYKLKSSSGITQVDKNGFGFNLYPLPSTDGKVTVDVSSKRLKPITFTVTDMTGRVVAVFNEKHTSLESSHAFDFSQLANGNYQLMISNDEESAVGRFTISK